MTTPRPGTLNQAQAATPVMTAKASPFSAPTDSSRRSPRHALALLPVADGFDGYAEPCGEFDLGEPRAPAQIAGG